MLSLGDLKDSLELLKDIGIDLESGEPIKEALKYYDKKILELEKLI